MRNVHWVLIFGLLIGCDGDKGVVDSDTDADTDTDADADSDADTDTDADADADTDADADADTDADTDPPFTSVTPYVQSGSRLDAVLFEDGAGATTFMGFYDTVLELPCTFLQTSPTTWHCLPKRGGSPRVVFGEATCADPILLYNPDCPLRDFEAMATEQTCASSTFTAYVPGAEVAQPDPGFSMYTGTCLPQSASGTAFAAATPAPVTGFVSGTRLLAESNGLHALVVEGDDGSRLVQRLATSQGTGCNPETMTSDGATRCLPSVGMANLDLSATFYADAACTQRLAYSSACPPDYVREVTLSPDTTIAVFEVGPQHPTGAPVYQDDTTACAEVEAPGYAEAFWAPGPAVPDSTFGLVQEVEQGGVFTSTWYADSTGVPVAQYRIEDREFHSPDGGCTVTPYQGGYACLPYRSELTADFLHFADDTCTLQPLISGFHDPIVSIASSGSMCGAVPWEPGEVDVVYERGAPHVGVNYQRDPTGTCVVSAETDFYVAMPISGFQVFTRVGGP